MATYLFPELTYMMSGSNITDYDGQNVPTANGFAYNLFNALSNHFDIKFSFPSSNLEQATRIIFEPKASTDPVFAGNEWRIQFEIKGSGSVAGGSNPIVPAVGQSTTIDNCGLYFKIGTPNELPDNGVVSSALPEYPLVPSKFGSSAVNGQTMSILNVDADWPRISKRNPMALRLTCTDRGFAMVAWIRAVTEDMRSSPVLCVQRGVGCSGDISQTEEFPLFMLTNCTMTGAGVSPDAGSNPDGPRDGWWYHVVRTTKNKNIFPRNSTLYGSNISDPLNGLYYAKNTVHDSREPIGTILNHFPKRWKTPVTTDTGEYILIFPYGMCSHLFAYTDEMDLIAVSKGNAYQLGQEIPVSVYGQNRVYTALTSNTDSFTQNTDTAIRVFILTGEDN